MTINLFLGLPKDSYLRISVQQEEAAEETPEIWVRCVFLLTAIGSSVYYELMTACALF